MLWKNNLKQFCRIINHRKIYITHTLPTSKYDIFKFVIVFTFIHNAKYMYNCIVLVEGFEYSQASAVCPQSSLHYEHTQYNSVFF